jgi:zinc D-Ala-D-Ala carboxypeptidase
VYSPKHFKWSEFDQKGLPGSGQKYMSHNFVRKLDELRDRCPFPFIITSGYRSPQYNQSVSDSGPDGPHTTGCASDIACDGQQAYLIVKHAMDIGFTGIGISQKGNKRYVHLDILTSSPRPNIWSY